MQTPRWLATTRWAPSDGELTTPPCALIYIVLEPPPSRWGARWAPSPCMSWPSSFKLAPAELDERPSTTTSHILVCASLKPTAVRGLRTQNGSLHGLKVTAAPSLTTSGRPLTTSLIQSSGALTVPGDEMPTSLSTPMPM